jgi:hypothetical protein
MQLSYVAHFLTENRGDGKQKVMDIRLIGVRQNSAPPHCCGAELYATRILLHHNVQNEEQCQAAVRRIQDLKFWHGGAIACILALYGNNDQG